MLHVVVVRFFFGTFLIMLTDRISMQVKRIDPQLFVVPEDYLSTAGYEPLPFLGVGGVADLKQTILPYHPLSGYNDFVGLPLPPCDHPTVNVG